MCERYIDWLPLTHPLQLRHVPCLGIEPVMFWFGAQSTEPHQPGLV